LSAHTKDSDWRLRGQQKYLQDASLLHRPFQSYDGRDHEHCAFCWAKFMVEDYPKVLHSGYCTPDLHHWICEACFQDFREKFGWQLIADETPQI
jgi:hypothetical protein